MKRPAFQFYPADWMKDLQLRSCSIAARGLWADMLCMAHESEQYGHLVINGKPMTDAQIVNNISGATTRMLAELESAGVFSRDEAGAVYSRRMDRDERFREMRARCGKLGGNPALLVNEVNQKVTKTENELKVAPKQTPTPSSSSSSSKNLKPFRRDEPDGFRRFWAAYPPHRRVGKAKCLEIWAKHQLEPLCETIISHVEAMKSSEQWQEGFDPSPQTYLNQSRWEDGLPTKPAKTPGKVEVSM